MKKLLMFIGFACSITQLNAMDGEKPKLDDLLIKIKVLESTIENLKRENSMVREQLSNLRANRSSIHSANESAHKYADYLKKELEKIKQQKTIDNPKHIEEIKSLHKTIERLRKQNKAKQEKLDRIIDIAKD